LKGFYGYRLADDGKVLIPDPPASETVRRLFENTDRDVPIRRQVLDMNEAKIQAPRGGEWTPGSVAAILRNAGYAGKVRAGDELVDCKDIPEPIVSFELWSRVQARRTERKEEPGMVRTPASFLRGYLLCSCGRRMTARSVPNKAFVCAGRNITGCKNGTLNRANTETYVASWLAGRVVGESELAAMVEELRDLAVTRLKEVRVSKESIVIVPTAGEPFEVKRDAQPRFSKPGTKGWLPTFQPIKTN